MIMSQLIIIYLTIHITICSIKLIIPKYNSLSLLKVLKLLINTYSFRVFVFG